MKTDDIINVNYTTEIHNMLIFARTGVMKDYKKHVFITHFPLILGQILIFSSKNIEKFRRGATNHHIHKMTKEKIFLLLTSVAGDFFCAPERYICIIHQIAPPRHRYVFTIKNTYAACHHFGSTNALRVQPQTHIIRAPLPRIPPNDPYVWCAPIHASQHIA